MSQGIKQKTVAGIPVTEVVTETDLSACLRDAEEDKKIIEYTMNPKMQILFGVDYGNNNVFCHDFMHGRPVPVALKENVVKPSLPENTTIIDIGGIQRSLTLFPGLGGYGANQEPLTENEAVPKLADRIGLSAEEILANQNNVKFTFK